MPKKAPPPVVEEEEEEEVTCPVCGKPVGLEVASCPYCGAEFESEEEEVSEEESPAEAEEVAPQAEEVAAAEEEDSAECPVCGKLVSLAVSSCPYCGAEFEEEEVEEIIEVEERAPGEQVEERPAEEAAEAEEAVQEEGIELPEAEIPTAGPTLPIDLKVIGLSLIVLGIIGSQISVFIDWYWHWVPPIGDNLGVFMAIPLVIIVAGVAAFMLIRRRKAAGKKVAKSMPGTMMSVLIFGVLAMIMIALWKPINDALQSSSATVAAAFFAVLVIGVLIIFMSSRMSARAAA